MVSVVSGVEIELLISFLIFLWYSNWKSLIVFIFNWPNKKINVTDSL